MYSILKRCQCVFLMQSKSNEAMGFIIDALFVNFAYLYSLYTEVELHKNFVFINFGKQA